MFASIGGASQFGGGGFLPLPSQGEGDKLTQPQQTQTNQTVRTLTFSMIQEAVEANGDKAVDNLMIDGHEAREVKSVCQVMDIQDTHAYVQYKVDDSTGTMLIRQFKSGNQVNPGVQVLSYVQIYGRLRMVESTLCLVAHSIRLITDYNMVYHHMLEAIHQHFQLTRGPLVVADNRGPASAPQDSSAFQPSAVGGGSMYGGNPMQHNMGTREDQFTHQLRRLFVDEGGADNPNGLHVDEIMRRLQGNWPRPEVDNLLSAMLGDGKLYNTTPQSYQWCS